MKRQVIHHSLLFISLCAPAPAQITQRWIAEASRPAAQEITIYRGETLALEPTITVHGAPYAWPAETEVTLWWQTAAMGALWWSAPAALGASTGALRAVWSPECDSGADRYTFFIRASAPSGIAYRASGTLIMRHSPGAVPNALPLPTPAIDFASIEIHNAPWLFESDWQSGSNALATAVLQLETDMRSRATTQQVADAIAPRATTQQVDAHVGATGNVHGLAAADIGALTNEADLAALRLHHYGDPDIVESPAEWFEFDGAGTITAFNYESGRENVVIPWEIGGVAVTALGAFAFYKDFLPSPVTSLVFPKGIAHIDVWCFREADALTNVVFSGDAPAIDSAFNQTTFPFVTVIDPRATGWGDTFANRAEEGIPQLYVVRPALHADEFYRRGLPLATAAQVSNIVGAAVEAIAAPAILRDGAWYRQAWDTNLQTTVWEPIQ